LSTDARWIQTTTPCVFFKDLVCDIMIG